MKPGPEFDRIRAFLRAARASAPEIQVPPGDDAAVVGWERDTSVVLSTDAFVEGVHFRRAWLQWDAVGYRATAAALSDMAAMAARPVGVLVSLIVPPETEEGTLVELGEGVGNCLRRYEAGLLGGDLAHTAGELVIDICALGVADDPIGRGGARVGDEVWLTGAVGGAAAAVRAWSRSLEPDPRARAAFERPTARVAEARWLQDRMVLKALIDVSDGLASDAHQIAAASRCRLLIDVDAVPLAPPLSEYASREAALGIALTGGEDYELLLCCQAGSGDEVRREFEERFGAGLTRIGTVQGGETGVSWTSSRGTVVPADLEGYDHFAPETDE
jgi:thiamine-monophosphate kinase